MVANLKTEQADDDHKKIIVANNLSQPMIRRKSLRMQWTTWKPLSRRWGKVLRTLKEGIKVLEDGIKT